MVVVFFTDRKRVPIQLLYSGDQQRSPILPLSEILHGMCTIMLTTICLSVRIKNENWAYRLRSMRGLGIVINLTRKL